MDFTFWFLIVLACAPMIIGVVWLLLQALDGGYYYSNEKEEETIKKDQL